LSASRHGPSTHLLCVLGPVGYRAWGRLKIFWVLTVDVPTVDQTAVSSWCWCTLHVSLRCLHWLCLVCLYRYLAQVLNETLRWAVVAPYAARVQDTDIVIDGHNIPAGVCSLLCLAADQYSDVFLFSFC